jgi:LysM repeat protein
VIFVKSGASLLGIAKEYDISLKHLLDFNELNENDDILSHDQLVYLQRKRKVGANEFHEVQPGENLYDICQTEAIRLESLLERNRLEGWQMPAVGEKLYLQDKAPERPKLASEVSTTVKQVVAQTTTTATATTASATQPMDQLTPANSSAVAASLHVVKDKETLYSIAKKYNITVEQLREWNKLTGYDLKIGQELVIYKN